SASCRRARACRCGSCRRMIARNCRPADKEAAMSDAAPPRTPDLRQFQRWALTVGVAALVLCVVAALLGADSESEGLFSRRQVFRSYLVAFLVPLGAALGSMAILMTHHLTGGGWGASLRP